MITVELKYPLNLEIKEFDLPLPNVIVDSGDHVTFFFVDQREYFDYLETLCDLIDSLYYEAVKPELICDKLACLTKLASLFNN